MKCEMVCFVGQKSMKIIRTLNCCSDQGCGSSHQFCLCQSCNFPGWKSGCPHHQLHNDQLPFDRDQSIANPGWKSGLDHFDVHGYHGNLHSLYILYDCQCSFSVSEQLPRNVVNISMEDAYMGYDRYLITPRVGFQNG